MKPGSYVAKGGLFAALCVVLLMMPNIFATIHLSFGAAASIVMLVCCLEIGKKNALIVYSAVSVLTLALLPQKLDALAFCCFFGYYPVLKTVIEGKSKKLVQIICKYTVFNLAFFLTLTLAVYVLAISAEITYTILFFLWIGANVAFAVYDYILTESAKYYQRRFKGKI